MSEQTHTADGLPTHLQRARERRWALGVAVGAMALTMLPYLFGLTLQGARPALAWYSWLGYNLDDTCVYLAWMRQAADGAFFQRNLFTTEPQLGHQFNLFFLALGKLAGLTHLPLLAVYHGARLLLGVALLRATWWLLEMLLPAAPARRAAFLLTCFSAGLGWVPGLWRADGVLAPADVWQPEAITFLCLYLSPLFLVSLLLMVGVIGWLVVGERTGRMQPALWAGLCGLALGNIHTYDVITLGAVWLAYLLARAARERRIDRAAWSRALLAGLLTAVSTGHMFYLVRTETVFARRVAVATLSPSVTLYALTYGPLLVLAAWGLWRAGRAAGREPDFAPRARMLLVTWAVVNVAVAYLPVSFQRKMLMGAHLPLAILAGAGLAHALPGRLRAPALAAAVCALALTNVRFMLRDAANFAANSGQARIQRPYMYAGEVAALEWLRAGTPPGTPVQPLPWVSSDGAGRVGFVDTTVACFAPGLSGRPVHAGHWGETPDFGATMGRWVRFMQPSATDAERIGLLRATGVRYLVFSQKREETAPPGTEAMLGLMRGAPPPYLRLVPEASNEDADVYEVVLPAG